MTNYKWVPVPLYNIRSLINFAVLLISDKGSHKGDLLAVDERGIFIEIGEGQIVEVPIEVLDDPMTQLFKIDL